MSERESLRDVIYANMELKTTEELQEIWEKNDRDEWSVTAFEIIKEILFQRTGELPQTQNPYQKRVIQKADYQTTFKFPNNRILRASTIALFVLIMVEVVANTTLPIKSNRGYQDLSASIFFLGAGICASSFIGVTTYYAWINNAKSFRKWSYDQTLYNLEGKKYFGSWELWLYPDWLVLWVYRIIGPIAFLLCLFLTLFCAYTIINFPFG
jgi:hypothetical protein